jgi:hypothetical protein
VEHNVAHNRYLHNTTGPSSSALKYGAGKANENVLAVFVDATQSELWCYEGGGIYRHVWIESAGNARAQTPILFAALR